MRFAGIMLSLFVGMTSVGFGGGAGVKDLSMPVKQYDSVAGREIYTNTCIRSHGIDGEGRWEFSSFPGRSTSVSQAVQSRLDASLFKRIHDGKPNTAMGAWSTTLSDDEIWDVLAYVRTLRQE